MRSVRDCRPGARPREYGDGAERAMYNFEAVVIAFVSRVVVPEMAWLINLGVLVREKVERGREREKTLPDEDGPLQHPVTVFGRDGAHENLIQTLVERIRTFRQLDHNRASLTARL
jgi:hypothetical protein